MSPLVDVYGPTSESDAIPTSRPGLKPFSFLKSKSKRSKKDGGAIDHAFVTGLKLLSTEVVDLRYANTSLIIGLL